MEVLKDYPNVINFVQSVSKKQGIEKYTIEDAKINEKGEGFLGQIFTIAIRDLTSDRKLDVVVKAAFTDERIRDIAPIEKCFLNEIHFYSEIEPALKKFEIEHGIPASNFVPKCYKVSSENGKEMLCLENLKALKFEAFEKTDIMDDEHVSLIFKVYGRFHANFFALKDQQPEDYARIVSKLCNIYEVFFNKPNSVFKEHLKEFNTLGEQYLVPGEDDEVIEKFKKYEGEGIADLFEEVATANCDYSTILHGDCWSNNMLFNYEGKKLVDMRLLDLQMVKLGSPVCDLSYCLYSGGSKTVFDQLDKYLKIYHESLSSCLRELGSDPEEIFPFDVLKRHWKEYSKFGMTMAFSLVKVKLTNKEDLIDFTDNFTSESFANIRFDKEEYKKRIRDLLYHMSEIDAL